MSNQEPYAEASDAAYISVSIRGLQRSVSITCSTVNSGAWFVLNQARYHKEL
ncbi:hypothetical protein [Paenibacillus sp. DMB20]|uniref:hypothetical protein n=1 Tax=Paenibacillus sp. DMB20 TaxID=1642570 RepID=UPI000A4DCDBB|nr:hypothetical protein [Paenibacillus sp. DMB20]